MKVFYKKPKTEDSDEVKINKRQLELVIIPKLIKQAEEEGLPLDDLYFYDLFFDYKKEIKMDDINDVEKWIKTTGRLSRRYADCLPWEIIGDIVRSHSEYDINQWESCFEGKVSGIEKQLASISDDEWWNTYEAIMPNKKWAKHFDRMCFMFRHFGDFLNREEILRVSWDDAYEDLKWDESVGRMNKLLSRRSSYLSKEEIIRLSFEYNASDEIFERVVRAMEIISKEYKGILTAEEVVIDEKGRIAIPRKAIDEKKKQSLKECKELGAGIRCPVHGDFLHTGRKIVPDNKSDKVETFFCKKCGKFYVVKRSDEKTITYGGKPIECIKAVVHTKDVGESISTEKKIIKLVREIDADILVSRESDSYRCEKCGREVDYYQNNIISVNLIDGGNLSIQGVYCRRCNAITVRYYSIKNLEKIINADYIKGINLNIKILSKEEIKRAQDRFDPKKYPLELYRGYLSCREKGHALGHSVTLEINPEIRITCGDYCADCDKYFASENEFNNLIRHHTMPSYLKVRRNVGGRSYNYRRTESILKKEGYNVSEKDGLSANERQSILARVMNDGILAKSEIADYLSTRINFNGRKKNNSNARDKWEEDLLFVRAYKSDIQEIVEIKHVTRKR